jgi:glycosyltransferase involved in cell wall biosynthesis
MQPLPFALLPRRHAPDCLGGTRSGRPVITTDAPGCRETVVHGWNGFLVPPRDDQALAKTMEIFIDKPELIREMGKRSRSLAVQKYDVHKVNAVILSAMGLESGAAIPERGQA